MAIQENSIPDTDKEKKHIPGWYKVFYAVCCIIIAVALIMLIIYIIIERHGRNKLSDLSEAFVRSINKCSGVMLYGLLSDEYIKFMETEYGYSKADSIKEMEDVILYFVEDVEDEEGYDIGNLQSVSLTSSSVKKEMENSVDEMKEYFKEELYFEIDDYKEVYILCDVKGDKRELDMGINLYTYKLGDKWYFIDWDWFKITE